MVTDPFFNSTFLTKDSIMDMTTLLSSDWRYVLTRLAFSMILSSSLRNAWSAFLSVSRHTFRASSPLLLRKRLAYLAT